MKFCKKYESYMKEHGQKKLPGVGFKKFKKILKRCRKQSQIGAEVFDNHQNCDAISPACSPHCPVCHGKFFPSLLEEMSMVVGFFNESARKLLGFHLASGLSKWFILLNNKVKGNQVPLVEEGKDLVTYAAINAVAMRKILKKYDKIHYSKQGQAFKSQAQSMHIELLQSPWLCELMAFHINSKPSRKVPLPYDGCTLLINDGKPCLTCELFDSTKLEIDLTCSVCLETMFEPVALTCGHIFCYMCACKAGSVTVVDGLKAVDSNKKCPICRESGVYHSAVHLDELQMLLRQCCPDWEVRRKSEKAERVDQTKKYWESQSRLFTGI